MKRITLLKTIILITSVVLNIGNAFTANKIITITLESSGFLSSYNSGAEKTWTQDGVSFGAKAVMKYDVCIQMQANNGVLYNTTPLPGRITGIKLTCCAEGPVSFCYAGSSRLVNADKGKYDIKGGKQIGSSSATGWSDTDFADTDYNYFAIKRGENVLILSKIEITYEEPGSSSVKAPTFSVAAGDYHTAQFIELNTETEDARIFYTTDNSTPTIESALYTEALFINSSTTVKAIAYKDGEASEVAEATYRIIYPYTITFNAGSGICDVVELTEETAEEGIMLPFALPCNDEWTFAGWAETETEETTTMPILYSANEIYYPEANAMFYAVYSQASGTVTDENIIINAGTLTGLRSSYADCTWIQDGITFRGNEVFKGTQGGLIQMNPERGDGMLYNITPIEGLKSITVNRASGEAPLTVYQGKSSKPASLSAGVLTENGTADISSGNEYFNIKAGGVLYISEIIVGREVSVLVYNSNPVCSISPRPVITVITGKEGIEFTDIEINKSGELGIYVEACKITEEMTVEITGNNRELFSFNLRDFDVMSGGYIYMSYRPQEVGRHVATLEITSADVKTVVPLIGTAINSGTGTGLNNISTFSFYSVSGKIYFTSTVAGENIEIYDLSGRLIHQGISVDGLNCIVVQPGFVLVKIGNILNKLIIK